jgi:hypothetical protein
VHLVNPFDRPCEVRLTLESPGGKDTASVRLSPGQDAVHRFAFPLVRRDDEFPAATVRASYHEAQGSQEALIGSAEERISFVLANPLRLTVAPVESGLRITLVDPSRSGFEGTAVINGAAVPVKMAGEAAELTTRDSRAGDDQPVAVELRSRDGSVVVPGTTFRFRPLAAPAYQAVLDGDAQVPAKAALAVAASPAGPDMPFARAWRLDYQFDAGWRFVRCVAATGRPGVEGQPDELGMWVYGDGSGNSLRTRITDDSGQTFQPTGPSLDWSGWRWVTFDLANLEHAGRWGGADDGRVHGSLRLDTVLLVDSTRNKTSGTLYFAGPTLVYAKQPGQKAPGD